MKDLVVNEGSTRWGVRGYFWESELNLTIQHCRRPDMCADADTISKLYLSVNSKFEILQTKRHSTRVYVWEIAAQLRRDSLYSNYENKQLFFGLGDFGERDRERE